jgi:hypothetical protein
MKINIGLQCYAHINPTWIYTNQNVFDSTIGKEDDSKRGMSADVRFPKNLVQMIP